MSRDNECRTCGHCWEVHDHHGMKKCFQDMGEEYGGFEFVCDCNTGFIPLSNLDYLEWEYGKKLAIESRNQSNEGLPNQ